MNGLYPMRIMPFEIEVSAGTFHKLGVVSENRAQVIEDVAFIS